jgi:hypothetical protein
MLKVANKYGVNFNALRLSEDLQKDMPVLLHVHARMNVLSIGKRQFTRPRRSTPVQHRS